MTTLHLKLHAESVANLAEIVAMQRTGFWRLSDETLEGITSVKIWADANSNGCADFDFDVAYTAPLNDWSTTDWVHGRARVLHLATGQGKFDRSPGTPPKFNRMGWALEKVSALGTVYIAK